MKKYPVNPCAPLVFKILFVPVNRALCIEI